MKKITDFINESKLEIQDNTLNYISVAELTKYLNVANKFLSPESKAVINYLISHNSTYIKDLSNVSAENALASFIDRKSPKNEDEKNLIKNCITVIKKGRILEIPVFQTKEQFYGIINGSITADEVIIDLVSEKGRNAVVKKYVPLVHKIVRQYVGKSNLEYEDMYSAGLLGLTYAMNGYGKNGDRQKKNLPDDYNEKINNYTFMQYAAQWIRIMVIDEIRNNSRTVRVPVSAQNREKTETGGISKSNTISGDAGFSDDENSKSLFDLINDFSSDSAERKLDEEDNKKLWNEIYKAIEAKFEPKLCDIFYSIYGLRGHEKIKNKDIAEKYNVTPQNITYYCFKINQFLKSDKELWDKLTDIYTFYQECLHDIECDGTHEPYIVTDRSRNMYDDYDNYNESTIDDDPDNFLWKFKSWFKENKNNLILDILLKSIMEMDEIKCRLYINEMINSQDSLSLKYYGIIKNFVNFMYDIVEENLNIDYASSIVRIAKLVGKDNIEKLSLSFNESTIPEEVKNMENYMLSNDYKSRPVKILIRYYCNHYDNIEKDKMEIEGSKEIKDQIYKVYKEICGEDPIDTISGLSTLCKYVLDYNIKY